MTVGGKNSDSDVLSRAQGCLLGQLIGDSLGSLVEFKGPEAIRRMYPDGVRDMADGGTFNTLAGQPTDDSEMALMLARSLVALGTFDQEDVRKRYVFWLDSGPFDVGQTIESGLRGWPIRSSQANGAMMRISPLGIFGVNYGLEQVAEWARQDAELTHIHPVCQEANALFTMGIAHAVGTGCSPVELYTAIESWADEFEVDHRLRGTIADAADGPPADYMHKKGWVLLAFRNALWQLCNAVNLEEGIVDSVMGGGDTDTNAAICGALMGAVYGREAVPDRWVETILDCRPETGRPGVKKPRPECFWPVDALELAEQLITPAA